MSRNILIALIAVLLVCLCLVVAGTGALMFIAARVPTLPPVTPLLPTSNVTADALLHAQIPERDLYQIVPRLEKNLALLTPVSTPVPRAHNVGDHDQFFVVEDAFTGKYRTANATLQVITPHSLFWVEDGFKFDAAALQETADYFEQMIYPTDQKYFGNVKPGLDGEARIHVFNGRLDRYSAGYFSSVDSYPRALARFSNQRNIIYMNIEASRLDSDEFKGALAHELQHLIHNVQAEYKTTWVDEGMGDLAIKVNGFSVSENLGSFARNPDTQLNAWANEAQDTYPHYAASYLFFDYTAERFGPDFTRAVIHAPHEGVNGVQEVLDQRVGGMRFEDLFADWAVANLLNDPSVGDGRYGYSNEKSFRVSRVSLLNEYPITRTMQIHEYAATYFALEPAVNGVEGRSDDASDVTIYFTGTMTTTLLPVAVHSGRWMWYSNRADVADTTLTRQFDLTHVSKATLQFWTWFDIEKDFDYAYVEVSTDGGKTWDILPGKHTTTSNPNGASYGHAFTGRSGASDSKSPAQWVQERMDLAAYAGKTIVVRFEYVTDDAYNAPSWAIDDITIPEINYSDGVEDGDGGWQAAGFIRTDNVVPQRYIVQVVEAGASTRVVRIPLDAQNRGNITINGLGKDVSRATLTITPFAPTTTEPTEYQFGITAK
jgi:immune inhibitor A